MDLPKVDAPWEQLKDRELLPFVRAIRSRVDMVMTAHVLNSALDPIYPATLSYSTITNGLRKELRYSKLVITDDLLTIKGEKKAEKEERKKDYHLVERSYGSFSRSLRLPFAAAGNSAWAMPVMARG